MARSLSHPHPSLFPCLTSLLPHVSWHHLPSLCAQQIVWVLGLLACAVTPILLSCHKTTWERSTGDFSKYFRLGSCWIQTLPRHAGITPPFPVICRQITLPRHMQVTVWLGLKRKIKCAHLFPSTHSVLSWREPGVHCGVAMATTPLPSMLPKPLLTSHLLPILGPSIPLQLFRSHL